jgi:DnaJ-domain-containing protein 1
MKNKRKANQYFLIAGVIMAIIWIGFVLAGTESEEIGDTFKERVSPTVGIATIFFFFAMGILFYIRSKVLTFNSSWSYNSHNRLEAFAILGLYMIKMERQDSQAQFVFFKQTLANRFKTANIDEVISDYLKGELPVTEVLEWFRKKGNEEEFINILDLLADLAFYNDEVNRQEMSFMLNAGKILGVNQQTIKSIFSIREQRRRKREDERRKSQAAPKKGVNYYRNKYLSVLGLNANSNFDEVKKAYRDLARKLHPDRFNRESEAEQKAAHERFTEINLAYEKLKEMMG